MTQLNIDFSNVPPQESIEPVPAGWYNVSIDHSEMKLTKDQTGQFLEVRYVVLDGQYKGRKVFDRFNLRNNSQQAVEIGYRQLSAVAHAVGVLQVADSEMLHNRPLKIKVKLRPAEGQYEASNEVQARKNINEQVDEAPAAVAAAAPVQAPPPSPPPPGMVVGGAAAGWGAAPPQPWGSAPPSAQAAPTAPAAAPAPAQPAPAAPGVNAQMAPPPWMKQ